MQGLMQQQPLMISSLLTHAARHHGQTEIISVGIAGETHRTTYAEAERRARRLATALAAFGITGSDRVGTLAWNGYRHFELYYAVSGMGAVIHTVNPRLHADDIAWIIENAADRVVFADVSFGALVAEIAPSGERDGSRRCLPDRPGEHAGNRLAGRHGAALL